MSSSQQWAGLSKPQSSRKSSGRNRGQKLPGTPFFQVDPVVSLDRLDHPKPKVARRRSRKASSKENRPASSSAANNNNTSLSVGAEFSTVSAAAASDGEKLSTDPRSELTGTATFGESSVTYASDDQTTQQFLANAGVLAPDDPVIGQTITYTSDEDAAAAAVAAAAAEDDDFRSGLSLSYSSTLNCNKIGGGDGRGAVPDAAAAAAASSSSYLEFDSSLCQYSPPAPFVDVPIPEKHPAGPSPVAKHDLMQPLLTTASDANDARDECRRRTGPPRNPPPASGFWTCFTCCLPQWSMSRLSRFII